MMFRQTSGLDSAPSSDTCASYRLSLETKVLRQLVARVLLYKFKLRLRAELSAAQHVTAQTLEFLMRLPTDHSRT